METVALAVVSLDGCLTRHDDAGVGSWASDADQAHFRSSLAAADVYVMGSATYGAARDAILARLDGAHRRIIMTRTPTKFAGDAVPGKLEFTADDPVTVISRMRADNHKRCLILGGGSIYNMFLGAGLVDELQLTLEPRVFGTGIRLAGSSTAIDASFTLVSVTHLSTETLLLKYRRP